MSKIMVMIILLCCLAACEFFTGKKKTEIDPKTGKPVVTYEDAPVEDWVKVLGALVPGLGIAGAAAARIARNAARARDGIMDANEEAIQNADWSQVNSAESFKVLLKTAQASHKDAKLLGEHYQKWKTNKT